MTALTFLGLQADELELAQHLFEGALARPSLQSQAHVLERLERKAAAALDHGRGPSVEQLQAALEILHDAGLITLTGPGVPADLGHAITTLAQVAEFYGDHAQYSRLNSSDNCPPGVHVGDPRVMIDRGSRARKALRDEAVRNAA